MFKTFLKHCIYEKCINVLFDSIGFNFFSKPNETREQFLERFTKDIIHKKDFFIRRGNVMVNNPTYAMAVKELAGIKRPKMNTAELKDYYNTRDQIRKEMSRCYA